MKFHIPTNQIKKISDIFHRGAFRTVGFQKARNCLFVILCLAEPVQHHKGGCGTAGIFGGLLIGFKLIQNMECSGTAHVVEIIDNIVPGLGMICFSTKGS